MLLFSLVCLIHTNCRIFALCEGRKESMKKRTTAKVLQTQSSILNVY